MYGESPRAREENKTKYRAPTSFLDTKLRGATYKNAFHDDIEDYFINYATRNSKF